MMFGMITETILQINFVICIISILITFRYSFRQSLLMLAGISASACLFTSWITYKSGSLFLMQYGYFTVIPAIFIAMLLLSAIKGIRFFFIALTAITFQQLLSILLMALRVTTGGYGFFYFLCELFAYGVMAWIVYLVRRNFHQIAACYNQQFFCLSAILLLLFLTSRLFSPVKGPDRIDSDLLLITLGIDLLIVLLYWYISISFQSLSNHYYASTEVLSLRCQLEEAGKWITQLKTSQEINSLYHNNTLRYLSQIETYISTDNLEHLSSYVLQLRSELEQAPSKHFCQNESLDLLLSSFHRKSEHAGIKFLVDTEIPLVLPITNTELCSLLSSAFDNAITAVQNNQAPTIKMIQLMIRFTGEKLLIYMENPYTGEIRIKNGLPVPDYGEQGFGIQNIESIVSLYAGLSSYETSNGVFILKIVI